jgi:hypothetical protein
LDAKRTIRIMKKWKRRVLITIAILLGIIIALVAFQFFDASPPDDGDFLSVQKEIPDESNGFAAIRDHLEKLPRNRGSLSLSLDPFEPSWDPAEAESVIAENASALMAFDACLRRPEFQIPKGYFLRNLGGPAMRTKTTDAGKLYDLVSLVSARLGVSLKHRDERAALADARAIVLFGHHIESARENWVIYLGGSTIKKRGLKYASRLVSRTQLPAGEILAFLDEVERCTQDKEGWRSAIAGEYAAFSEEIDSLVEMIEEDENPELKRSILKCMVQPNATKRLALEACRVLADEHEQLIEKGRREGFEEILGPPPNWWWPPRNFFGKVMCALEFDRLNFLLLNGIEEKLHLEIPRVMFAIRRFRDDRGNLPEDLSSLVPAYLKEIPNDPFDGKRLKYSREKKSLYSVGADLVDGGGMKREKHLAEPTFEIE